MTGVRSLAARTRFAGGYRSRWRGQPDPCVLSAQSAGRRAAARSNWNATPRQFAAGQLANPPPCSGACGTVAGSPPLVVRWLELLAPGQPDRDQVNVPAGSAVEQPCPPQRFVLCPATTSRLMPGRRPGNKSVLIGLPNRASENCAVIHLQPPAPVLEARATNENGRLRSASLVPPRMARPCPDRFACGSSGLHPGDSVRHQWMARE